MSLLDTLRKLRGTGARINQDAASLDAEIATLRAEEADLLRRPLPFEDWRAHLLESIAYQAGTAAQMQRDSIRGLLTSGHTGKLAPDTDGSYRGETRYGVDGVVKNWDVLQMTRFRPDAPGTAGLAMPFVLFLLKDRILAELPDLLEPLRAVLGRSGSRRSLRAFRSWRASRPNWSTLPANCSETSTRTPSRCLKASADARNPHPGPLVAPHHGAPASGRLTVPDDTAGTFKD